MSRARGGRNVTSRASISTVPSVASSRPAIIRSNVDFPQPDGPTSTRNSPLAIVSETSSTATTPLPYSFVRPLRTICATQIDLYRTEAVAAMVLTALRLIATLGRRHGDPPEGHEAEPREAAGPRPDRAARRRHGDSPRAPAQRRPRRLARDAPRRARRAG